MKTYKNPISTAMAEYREDFRDNKEWWTKTMGTGRNNEYLWIEFKNGDNITVQSDYFQLDGNTCLPRFRADEVAYISRFYGDDAETTTAADVVVDADRIILYRDGVECFRCEMTEEEFKEMRRQMWELDDETDPTAWMLDYCRAFATSKMNHTPETPNPENTPTTMNANEATEMGKTFNVYLWCGCGYCLDCFSACACCEEEALDKVVTEVIAAGYTDYYMSEEEMEHAISDGVVYAFPDFNEVEGWMYIDATMEGAPYPVWLRTENLKIESA